MTVLAVRPLLSAAVATVALGATAFAGAPAAFAAPGDNGDVKIHRMGTKEPDQSNHPKVCKFHLAAFNFDGLQKVHWEISNQPATNGPVAQGDVVLNGSGDGYTADMALPDGMYKLDWTFEGEQGSGKHKVFRVDCLDGNGGNGKPPHGPVGAGGGGSIELASEDGSVFGVGAALAAGLAGTAGLILFRRSRRRTDGAA